MVHHYNFEASLVSMSSRYPKSQNTNNKQNPLIAINLTAVMKLVKTSRKCSSGLWLYLDIMAQVGRENKMRTE